MRIIRYRDSDGRIGYAALQPEGPARQIDGDPFDGYEVTQRPAQVSKVLAPVIPPVFLCIGLNYRQHAEESGAKIPEHPVLFMKAANALQNPDDPIVLPTHLASTEVDYECELVVIIGRNCKNATRQTALDYVMGYTCGNDVSARDWQLKRGGGQWCRGKTFDTFAPLGPCLVTRDEIQNPNRLRLRTVVNGQVLQDGNTSDMIFDVPTLIEFLSGSTTLLPGTAIMTGTPQGVGVARKPPLWLKVGDTVTIDVERIGQLTNRVQAEGSSETGGVAQASGL